MDRATPAKDYSKLSIETKFGIVTDYEQGVSQRKLAVKYNCTRTRVQTVLKRKLEVLWEAKRFGLVASTSEQKEFNNEDNESFSNADGEMDEEQNNDEEDAFCEPSAKKPNLSTVDGRFNSNGTLRTLRPFQTNSEKLIYLRKKDN